MGGHLLRAVAAVPPPLPPPPPHTHTHTHTAPQRSSTGDSADPVWLLLAGCASTVPLKSRVSGNGSCPGRLEPLCSPALLSEMPIRGVGR